MLWLDAHTSPDDNRWVWDNETVISWAPWERPDDAVASEDKELLLDPMSKTFKSRISNGALYPYICQTIAAGNAKIYV